MKICPGGAGIKQKGFLLGVRGIQEHSHLLQTAIEEAKASRRNMFIAWLELANAFGSIPHAVLGELFGSLTLPGFLKCLLQDVYSENHLYFVIRGGGPSPSGLRLAYGRVTPLVVQS